MKQKYSCIENCSTELHLIAPILFSPPKISVSSDAGGGKYWMLDKKIALIYCFMLLHCLRETEDSYQVCSLPNMSKKQCYCKGNKGLRLPGNPFFNY